MYDTPEKIAKELEELMSAINDLHRKGESKDREEEIEDAYKNVSRAVSTIEGLPTD